MFEGNFDILCAIQNSLKNNFLLKHIRTNQILDYHSGEQFMRMALNDFLQLNENARPTSLELYGSFCTFQPSDWMQFGHVLFQSVDLKYLDLEETDVFDLRHKTVKGYLGWLSFYRNKNMWDAFCDQLKKSHSLQGLDCSRLNYHQKNDIQSILERNRPVVTRVEFEARLSRIEFDAMSSQMRNFEKQLEVPLEAQQAELACLRNHIEQLRIEAQLNRNNTGLGFLSNNNNIEKIEQLIKQQEDRTHYLEEQTIIRQRPAADAYYRDIQTYFSGLMVASLGIGSGYLAVTQGPEATIIGWIADAIASAFPVVGTVANFLKAGVNCIDEYYRLKFLERVREFGTNMTEAEIFGEKIARSLVRAYCQNRYRTIDENTQQCSLWISVQAAKIDAAKDAKAIITAIANIDPKKDHIRRNETAAQRLLFKEIGFIGELPHLPIGDDRANLTNGVDLINRPDRSLSMLFRDPPHNGPSNDNILIRQASIN